MKFTVQGFEFEFFGDIPYENVKNKVKESSSMFNFWRYLSQKRSNLICYDIGAHAGIYSSIFRALGMIVHAFEPSARYRKILKNNADYVHPVALSNQNIYNVESKLNDCPGENFNRTYIMQTIDYVVLDDYVTTHNLPLPNFIKIDIEGMETLALFGMEKILKSRPILQIEYHKGLTYKDKNYPGFVPIEQGGFDFNSLENYAIFDSTLKPKTTTDMVGNRNYFFIPKELSFSARKL